MFSFGVLFGEAVVTISSMTAMLWNGTEVMGVPLLSVWWLSLEARATTGNARPASGNIVRYAPAVSEERGFPVLIVVDCSLAPVRGRSYQKMRTM